MATVLQCIHRLLEHSVGDVPGLFVGLPADLALHVVRTDLNHHI